MLSAAQRVLLVGLPPVESASLAQIFAEAGYAVAQAADGDDALRRMRSPGASLVAIGIATAPGAVAASPLHSIRAEAGFDSTAVLALLPEIAGQDIAAAVLDAGADAYLRWPWDSAELLAVVRAQLRPRELADRRNGTADSRHGTAHLAKVQRLMQFGTWELEVATGRMTSSEQARRIAGLESADLAQGLERLAGVSHPDDREALRSAFARLVEGEGDLDLEQRILRPDGGIRWVRQVAELVKDADGEPLRVTATILDITEEKAAEARIDRLSRLYRILSRTSEAIVRIKDADQLFVSVCRLAVDDGGFCMAAVMEFDSRTGNIRPVTHAGEETGYFAKAPLNIYDPVFGRGITGVALRTGQYAISNDLANDSRMAPWRDAALDRGYRSGASFPIRRDNDTVWTLALYAAELDYFQADEIEVLQSIVDDLSMAIQSLYREERRRNAEDALADAQRQQQLILEAVGEGVAGLDAKGVVLFANPVAAALLGWARAEMIGRDAHALVHHHREDGGIYAEDDCPIRRTLRDGKTRWIEDEVFLHKDGRKFPVEYVCSPLRNEAGNVSGAVVTFRDISARTRAEEQLRQRESLLLEAQMIGRMGFWIMDLQTRRLTWSEATCKLFGIQPEEFAGTYAHFYSIIHPDDQKVYDAAHARVSEANPRLEAEYRIRQRDGTVRWMYERGNVEFDASGRQIRRLGMVMDITERKHAEASLRDSEERFRLLSRAANDAIWDWNLVTQSIWFNAAFATLVGRDGNRATRTVETWTARIHPDDRDAIRDELHRLIAGRDESWSRSYRYLRADGSYAHVHDRCYVIRGELGKAVRIVGAMTDVTERFDLAERLRQSERLESVGQLTGGVAHDFNNLLTVILGNAELLGEGLQGDVRGLQLAEMIVGAAQRGAELTQRLLAFARKQVLDPKAVDVNELVGGMAELLERTLGEHIEIAWVKGEGLWPALVDPGQLENALLNLCLNARDAMEGGGRLTIETRNVELDEEYASRQVDVLAGRYVLVAASDNGKGIAAEHLDRVFEPFFTTKEKGKGTGLGLPMVYGFVKQSGGHITLYSEEGEGTTVKMYLPCPEGGGKAGAEVEGEVGAGAAGGTEMILLVEDDALVRRYAEEQLRALGYGVVEAENGAQALGVLRERGDIALLFTDVVMPGGMGGRELAKAAVSLRPGLKVLYTSGYTADAMMHHGRLDAGVHLLQKPYRRAELARKLRQALGRRDSLQR